MLKLGGCLECLLYDYSTGMDCPARFPAPLLPPNKCGIFLSNSPKLISLSALAALPSPQFQGLLP